MTLLTQTYKEMVAKNQPKEIISWATASLRDLERPITLPGDTYSPEVHLGMVLAKISQVNDVLKELHAYMNRGDNKSEIKQI